MAALVLASGSGTVHAEMFGSWEQKFLPEARLCVAQIRASNQPAVSWAEVVGPGGSLAYALSVPDPSSYRPGQRVPASLDGRAFSLAVTRIDGPHVMLAMPGKAESDA